MTRGEIKKLIKTLSTERTAKAVEAARRAALLEAAELTRIEGANFVTEDDAGPTEKLMFALVKSFYDDLATKLEHLAQQGEEG